jgi:hypothetical protein
MRDVVVERDRLADEVDRDLGPSDLHADQAGIVEAVDVSGVRREDVPVETFGVAQLAGAVVLHRPREQPVDIACCDVHAETAPEQRAASQAWAPSRLRHCAVKQGRLRMRSGLSSRFGRLPRQMAVKTRRNSRAGERLNAGRAIPAYSVNARLSPSRKRGDEGRLAPMGSWRSLPAKSLTAGGADNRRNCAQHSAASVRFPSSA